MTYGEIYKQFLERTEINREVIEDYRPCCEMFDVPNIPMAIVVWLKGGSKVIYIADAEGERGK